MQLFKRLTFLILVALISKNAISQNVMLNILTQKSGIVKKGESLFLEASITNTNSKDFIGIYKLKVQIIVPAEIISIDTTGHILPTGWKISSNNGSSMIISNGMDMIAATDNRNILISIKGKKVGGASTIMGQLSFSDGVAPGTAPGSLKSDLPGDMKITKLFTLLFAACIFFLNTNAQTQLPTNVNVNIVTANAGVVGLGAVIDLSVSVTNTGTNPVQRNRVRPSISIPSAIGTALANGLQTGLPAGWVITTNTTGSIVFCNGTDVIPAGETRTVIIKIEGTALGGPSSIIANMQFGPGTSVCTGLGTLTGDNSADNTSSTTMTVITIVPLNLKDYGASLKDCKPILRWTTEAEINTDRFEIERSNGGNAGDWKSIGTLTANGNSTSKINYAFTDDDPNLTSEKVFYRLKMIDKNGSFIYSKTLPVLRNCKTTTISVYPNPVQDGKLYISLAGTIGYAEASLISTSGQVLLKSKMSNGTNYLNVANVAEGIYVVNVKDANGFDKNIKVSVKH
jgi:Secretion system C-terminal sorting domain